MSPRRTEIRIGPDLLEEREDGEVAVSARREHVIRVELARGTPAERPILQLALAVVALVMAARMGWSLAPILWYGRPHTNGWAYLAGASVFASVMGIGLIRRALQRREYLLVTRDDGTRRKMLLPVDLGDAERDEIEAQLRAHGWPFVRSRV